MSPIFLTVQNVVDYQQKLIDLYGGQHGIRDISLLESAVRQAEATFAGEYLHPFPFGMAAAYGFHICANHPFLDGNKRAATYAMLVFLHVNGLETDFQLDELERIMRRVSNSEAEKQELEQWLERSAK
jgi:death-on-curing protein